MEVPGGDGKGGSLIIEPFVHPPHSLCLVTAPGFQQVFEAECGAYGILPYLKHREGELVEIKLTHNKLGPKLANSLAKALQCKVLLDLTPHMIERYVVCVQECNGLVSVVMSENGLLPGPVRPW